MANFKTGWYLLYTKPKQEWTVSKELTRLQMKFYFPLIKALRTWSDRKKYIDVPLFPSYIFVYLENMYDYYNALGAEGVLSYVRFGREIATIKECQVEEIRLIVEQGAGVESSGETFHEGQQLVIQQGPLTGVKCEMVKYNGSQRLLVRLYLLQRNLLFSLTPESVCPAVSVK